jgi:hypothetical protein
MDLPVNYNNLSTIKRRIVREQYILVQNGKCCHCGKPLSGKPDRQILEMKIDVGLFPKNFFKFPVHLHHNHETGMTIGAVHNYCNAVLWVYYGV